MPTRRLPKSKIRIVGRSPEQYALELQVKLEEIDDILQSINANLDEMQAAIDTLNAAVFP